ncbi:TetR/AcrR family transcriptional regulator [Nocardia sp. NEAU-G5]|uniref:TetR/AcrR family transcriptional regulator n=2 Tax=Nocardia albiluteola TaxID=2842303 RepID=A0ABS6B6C4_9NOCA|nr:TetR/AcrR family transcriptional regulator [Nocardia albiluteola]
MRADAKKNHDHLLTVAGAVLTEQGADASLRDIARRAGVGLATLLRHFPTREALLEALLRTVFDELAETAAELETSHTPEGALASGRSARTPTTRDDLGPLSFGLSRDFEYAATRASWPTDRHKGQ